MHLSPCASHFLIGAFNRREPRFVRQHHLEAMVPQAKASKDVTALMTAMLFLTSYTFMLRLPSEAIPIAKNLADEFHIGQKATCLTMHLKTSAHSTFVERESKHKSNVLV